MPKALITGITGQDGSYLTEMLLDNEYEVHGIVRRTSSLDRSRLQALYTDSNIYGKRLFLHYADLDDTTTLRRIMISAAPDEVYHLAGQSHVGLSFEIPESTCNMTGMATLRILEMIQDLDKVPRFFHAASSEVFGKPEEIPQSESTPFRPVNPYGAAKTFATNMVSIYRNTFGVFAVNGIMFNHESPRRGENFVTRKICRAAAAIKLGQQNELLLGDTSAKRDWGHAKDYVRGMWHSLSHATAEDYVFATGKLHSVQDVVDIAFRTVDLDPIEYVHQDQRFMRPAEPQRLVGDPSKAKRLLNWEPEISFHQMIEEMTQAELKRLSNGD